jgi:hypothetical protein
MTNTPTEARFAAAGWLKSSYSAANNECVEVAFGGDVTGVRDSKVAHGPELALPATAFAAFLDGVKGDGLGRRNA